MPRPNAFVEGPEPEFDGPGIAMADLLEPQREVEQLSSNLEQLTIASQAEDNGAKKTPDEWFDYYSKLTDGGIMASASDLYHHWKLLKKISETVNQKEAKRVSELVAGFRDDFDWPRKSNYLVGGTRLEYSADSLETTIIQHYNCKKPELVKTTRLEVPEYLDVSIVEVTGTNPGLKYLQTLFDTEDDAETMMQTLEFISAKDRDKIKIWTPPINPSTYRTRKSYLNRAAGFSYDDGSFHVDGGIRGRGCSRRVDVGAAAGGAPQNTGVPSAPSAIMNYDQAIQYVLQHPENLDKKRAAELITIATAYLSK